jgi:hypothetical protein
MFEHPKLVEECRLVAEPPGGIERRLVRACETTECIADERERILPGDRLVLVGPRVIAQWLGDPPNRL